MARRRFIPLVHKKKSIQSSSNMTPCRVLVWLGSKIRRLRNSLIWHPIHLMATANDGCATSPRNSGRMPRRFAIHSFEEEATVTGKSYRWVAVMILAAAGLALTAGGNVSAKLAQGQARITATE